jgi:hypothetical protein
MDETRFNQILRVLAVVRSRRDLTRLLFGLITGSAAGATHLGAAAKKCGPCKKKKQGKCAKQKRDGTPCPSGTCQNGRCCVPEHPAATCAGAPCGTALNNTCGQAVACNCPSGQRCLPNGSCAIICAGGGCRPGCFCSIVNTEGAQHCLTNDGIPCAERQDCSGTGTAGCPAGMHCQTSGCGDRCITLCPG